MSRAITCINARTTAAALAAFLAAAFISGCANSSFANNYSAPAPEKTPRLNLSMSSGDSAGISVLAKQTAPAPAMPAYAAVPALAE
ncbi:hypothetical protein BH11PLA1_BH11PLA1_17740 [soil metagenome]